MPILDIADLHFAYGPHSILSGVNFTLEAGETVAIMGASGVGKSTLFKLIAGMLPPYQGKILISGQPLPQAQHSLAYMTQADLLLPWRSVFDNLMLPFELGATREESRDPFHEILEKLGLADCASHFPHELSGGMRQRVSLARSLLLKRPLLLLDEPFGSLDFYTREQMYALLKASLSQTSQALLMVTHDFRDALALADRILLLAQGTIAKQWCLKTGPLDRMQAEMRACLDLR